MATFHLPFFESFSPPIIPTNYSANEAPFLSSITPTLFYTNAVTVAISEQSTNIATFTVTDNAPIESAFF